MEENNVAVKDERAAKKAAAEKIKKRKKRTKRIIGLVIILTIVGGIAFGMYSLLHDEEPEKTVWSDFVMRGSIQSKVEGNGTTKAQKSATLTLTSGGVVREVFVSQGQKVNEGDPLYTVDSTEAEKAVEDAKKNVQDYQKQIDALNKSYANLTMTAPFAGKVINIADDLKVGNDCAEGKVVGMLVDDKTMKLSLYFSYAYEKDIVVGKTAQISIPSTMNIITGKVESINKVERISKEGSKLFEVVFTMQNPGTLTADMGATAILTGSAGEIYPYEPGTLTYNRSQELKTKAGGELVAVGVRNYADVSAGQVLLQMKGDSNDNQMAALSTSMKTAQDALVKAEKNLLNYNAVAPISGTVISCSLTPGETAEANRVAITIADTTVLIVDAKIDEMNVSYVKPGMMCNITDYSGSQSFVGVVETVSLEGKMENGYSYFPATIRVDNNAAGGGEMGGDMAAMDGMAEKYPTAEGGAAGGSFALQPGMNVSYSMVASQSEDCLLVPQQAVKYAPEGTVVFIKADQAPENALTTEQLGTLQAPEGFYAVPVSVGLSDQTNAEILSGVEEGQEVFIQYMTNQGDSWSGGGMGVAVAMG